MEFHIELTEDLVAQGMSGPEARAAAHRKFGNMTQKSEESRSTWIARWMGDLVQDLRYAFRGMRRDAGFTAFTILIAGLGIGASSTVFSVVDALLLRRCVSDLARLVWISNGEDNASQTEHYSGPTGVEPLILRYGRLVRLLPPRRPGTDGNRQANVSPAWP